MKKLSALLLSVLLSSCAIDYSLVTGDFDDMYVMRHYNYGTRTWDWYQYSRSYVYPSFYNPYPHQVIVVRPMPQPQNNYTYEKRPSRQSLPGQRSPLSSPGRGRN